MSAPTTPPRPEGLTGRLKSFRNPTRAFTMSPPRPASPTTTASGSGRATPTRSMTRDSSSPATKRSSLPLFTRKSGLGSKGPSSDAVNEFGAKTAAKDEPATAEAPKQATEAPKQDAEAPKPETDAPKADVDAPKDAATPGHTRARSGSTVSSQGPMTPPPVAATSEPIEIPKSEDPISDSPHDGASIASSRSPSRLRRQVSNLSRHSISGSIRQLSLLGPSSPPQVESTPVVAVGEMQRSVSRSASISSLRRQAGSPEPAVPEAPEPAPVESAPKEEPAPQPEPAQVAAPQPEPVQEEPQPEPAQPAPQPEPVQAAPQPEPAQVAPEPEPAQAAPQPEPAPVKESTPAPSTKAPSTTEAPQPAASKAAEPQTPVKPSASRNASTSSLTRSPTPDKPEPKRRGTLSNWARKSIDKTLDRRSSVSSPPPSVIRSPSRGPAESGGESDNESIKERERRWNTGLPVPKPPTPKKSEDNIKRRFSLGRRSSESGTKTPSESITESDKKPNWASKILRAGSKSKKDKADGSSTTPEASTVDVTSTQSVESPIEPPRPSIAIPNAFSPENRPLSAIVESPAVPLNTQAILALDAAAAAATSPLAAPTTAATESPVAVKAEEPSPETSPVLVDAEPATPAIAAVVEPKPATPVEAPAAPELVTEANPTTEVAPVEATATPVATEPEQPKDAPAVPVEEAAAPVEAPAPVEGVAVPEPETSTPPTADAEATPAAPENLLSPVSPNSPASSPWDASLEREIARARSPRRSTGGPSNANRSLRASPAPSIIGVKRRHPDEPEVAPSRVRYLPDWAVSPAIQLAVTLSLVLPRRRRDVANPQNRKRGWFWRSSPRTELRYNAIRGVNEEVPIVSKSWAVPAAVRTTAKVATAPARWLFHFFVPRSTRG